MDSLCQDNIIKVWWQPEDITRLACERLTRNLSYEEWQQYLGVDFCFTILYIKGSSS